MPKSEIAFIAVLAGTNLAAGLGLALVLSRRLGAIDGAETMSVRRAALLVIVYFVECFAFAAGMATQVLTIGLAVVWGIVLGRWLRSRGQRCGAAGTLVLFGVYTSLPSASFGLLLLLAMGLAGADLVNPVDGAALGIPPFIPWPMNTILGFCLALAVATPVVKTALTAGLAALLSRPARAEPVGR